MKKILANVIVYIMNYLVLYVTGIYPILMYAVVISGSLI